MRDPKLGPIGGLREHVVARSAGIGADVNGRLGGMRFDPDQPRAAAAGWTDAGNQGLVGLLGVHQIILEAVIVTGK
jgi:hypothetical protein